MSTNLARALRERREELGQSKEQAAVYIGTSRPTYTKWENGVDHPTHFKWVSHLAAWLDMPEEDVSLMIVEAMHAVPSIAGEQTGGGDDVGSQASGGYHAAAA